nr:MAG TPA: hypothetical protein [Caudoviricetes sp.]
MYVRSLFEKIFDRNTKVISKDFKLINLRLASSGFPMRENIFAYPCIF